MLIAHNDVAAPIPGLTTIFEFETGDQAGSFGWQRRVAEYVSEAYTSQHSYTSEYPYLKSYEATFTPRGPIPAEGLGSLYYDSGVAEYSYQIGPWPPGAIVETRITGSAEKIFDRDLALLGTNYLTQGQVAEESASTFGFGLPYNTADMQPGKMPPSFSFSASVKSIRLGGRLSKIMVPIHGDLFTPTDTFRPWLKWYQTYTDELNFGHGIDALPSGLSRNIGLIEFGDGKTFWAPTSPRDGVIVCELLDEVAGDRVSVHYRNLISQGGSGVETCVLDLAESPPRYVDARQTTYGNRLHATTNYSGLYSVAERPAIVVGAGGYGPFPAYTLPSSETKMWKLHDYFTKTLTESNRRRSVYWSKRQELQVRISIDETGFSWGN